MEQGRHQTTYAYLKVSIIVYGCILNSSTCYLRQYIISAFLCTVVHRMVAHVAFAKKLIAVPALFGKESHQHWHDHA